MKKIILMLTFVLAISVSYSQSVKMSAQYSTDKQVGLNVYHVNQFGTIVGIGGSYLFNSYFGETNGKYQELVNYQMSVIDPSGWGIYKPYYYKTFTENRGTVKLLLGQTYKNTEVIANVGLGFRSQYWCGKDGISPIVPADPAHRYFYTYKNISPSVLYGLNLNQKVSGRFGISLGWNNVEKFNVGINYRITPTSLFNW